jgi:cytochrome c oxidase cbb3-type subunit 4
MSPFWGHVVGVFTVVVMAAFIGVWIWAWLPFHKRAFDALAAIPMQDGDDDSAETADAAAREWDRRSAARPPQGAAPDRGEAREARFEENT